MLISTQIESIFNLLIEYRKIYKLEKTYNFTGSKNTGGEEMSWNILYEKTHWEDRRKHREEVSVLLDDFLSKQDEGSLIKLISSLWASLVFQDVASAVKKRILDKGHTPTEIANRLSIVKQNPEKLLESTIPGFGPSSLTEILYCLYPDKYAMYNKRSREVAKDFGYKELKTYTFDAEKYHRFMETINKIYEEYAIIKKDIEKQLGIKIPKYDFVDGIVSLLYEKKISVEDLQDLKRKLIKDRINEAAFNYALGSIQGAIKQYLFWIKKGVTEEKAIDRAVNYALGMIESSGTLKDPKNREKLIIALEAMAGLARGIAKVIRDLEQE